MKTLRAFKKRPEDKCFISKLKHDDLLALWKQWIHRIDVNPSGIINGDERLPRKRQLLTEGDINDNGTQVTNQTCNMILVQIPPNVPTPNSNVGIYEQNNSNY